MGEKLDKLKKFGTRKIQLPPEAAVAILTGSAAAASVLTAGDILIDKAAAEGSLATIKHIEPAAKKDGATNSLAALQDERIKATSRIIQDKTATGWLAGLGITSAATAGFAVNRLLKKRKPEGEEEAKGKS